MAEFEFDPVPPGPESTARPTDDVSANPVQPVVSLSQAVVEEPNKTSADTKPEGKPLKDDDLIAVIAQVSSIGLPPELAEQYAKDVREDPLLNWGFSMIGMAEALEKMGFNGSGQSLPPWMRVAGGLVIAGWVIVQNRSKYGQPLAQPAPVAPDGVRAPDFSGAYATSAPVANPQTGGENG